MPTFCKAIISTILALDILFLGLVGWSIGAAQAARYEINAVDQRQAVFEARHEEALKRIEVSLAHINTELRHQRSLLEKER